jgi:ribonuclease P/MRP protein subunit RPP40
MLLNTINEWQSIWDRNSGGHIYAIALDWEKAFDRVPHPRLLTKLRNASIDGVLHSWFTSYLKNRKQRVLFSGELSEIFNVPSGVKQGSALGPPLFNSFVADLANCVSSRLVMYADDSTLFRHIESFQDELDLQNDLSNIFLWSINNNMQLNIKKCLFMDVTLSSLRRVGRYCINEILIKHTDSIKLLGVHI